MVISSVAGDFELEVDLTKVNNKELLILENPRCNPLGAHLKVVPMDEVDKKAKLPVHLILGANEFAHQDLSPDYLAVNSNSVFGLADTPAGDQFHVY